MLETNVGRVRNLETRVEKEVVAKATPYSLKDIVIAGIIMLAGFAYMTVTAFNNGARACSEAEDNALIDAGIKHGEHVSTHVFIHKTKK